MGKLYLFYDCKRLKNKEVDAVYGMTNENVRFFQSFLEGLSSKSRFSYSLSYLIDKKGYRKGKILREKDCRFKKYMYFCS